MNALLKKDWRLFRTAVIGSIVLVAAPYLIGITGYIVAGTKSFSGAFVAAAAFLLLGIGGYVFLLGRIEPIPEPAP